MKDALETILKGLVNEPSEISIEEINDGSYTTFKVKVAQTDMGRVIGKEGKVVKAVRQIMKAIAAKESKKVNIEICE